jgi:hypothetical protein
VSTALGGPMNIDPYASDSGWVGLARECRVAGRFFINVVLILVVVVLLSACGQKGPLYLPEPVVDQDRAIVD